MTRTESYDEWIMADKTLTPVQKRERLKVFYEWKKKEEQALLQAKSMAQSRAQQDWSQAMLQANAERDMGAEQASGMSAGTYARDYVDSHFSLHHSSGMLTCVDTTYQAPELVEEELVPGYDTYEKLGRIVAEPTNPCPVVGVQVKRRRTWLSILALIGGAVLSVFLPATWGVICGTLFMILAIGLLVLTMNGYFDTHNPPPKRYLDYEPVEQLKAAKLIIKLYEEEKYGKTLWDDGD